MSLNNHNHNNSNQYFPSNTFPNSHDHQKEASTRDEAIEMLKLCFSQDAEIKRQQQMKIDELSQIFPDISKEVVTEALKEKNWDVDLAIIPLFQNHEAQEKDKKKQEHTRDLLSQFYSHFSEEDVSKVLAYNNYNFEKTAAQLLETIKQQERLKRQKEEARRIQYDHDQKVSILEKKFPDLKRPEIVEHLKRNNWDVYVAGTKLLKINEEKKIETLRKLFKTATQQDITAALESANWDFVGAVDTLKKASARPKASSTILQQQQQQSLGTSTTMNFNKSIISDRPVLPLLPEQSFLDRSFYLEKQIGEDLLTSQHNIDPEWVNIIKDDLRQKVKIVPPEALEETQKVEEAQMDMKGSNVLGKSSCLNGYELIMEPELADLGDEMTVRWIFPGDYQPQSYDWIALYQESENDPQKYITYVRTSSKENNGTVKFKAPNEYGRYLCRYYKNNTYRILAQSNVATVQPKYKVCVEKVEDRKVVVKIVKESGNEHPNAWVALYPAEVNDFRQFVNFQWLAQAKNTRLEFNVPKTGHWRLELFPTKNYVSVARCDVNVEGNDKLELSFSGAETYVVYEIKTIDVNTDKAWVGLYFTDEQNYRQYRRSKTLSEDRGRIVFKTPIHAGTYHIRLYAGSSITPIAFSNPITVPDTL